MCGTCRTYGESRSIYIVLLGNVKERDHLEDLMSVENNSKINPEEIEWEGLDWISIAEDRDKWWAVVNTVVNLVFHKMCGIFLTNWEKIILSKRTLLHALSQSFNQSVTIHVAHMIAVK